MTIEQMKNANRQMHGMPCVGDIRNNHVIVSVGAGFVLAVPKDRAVKFTVQEWNDMVKKEDLK